MATFNKIFKNANQKTCYNYVHYVQITMVYFLFSFKCDTKHK